MILTVHWFHFTWYFTDLCVSNRVLCKITFYLAVYIKIMCVLYVHVHLEML